MLTANYEKSDRFGNLSLKIESNIDGIKRTRGLRQVKELVGY